MKREGWILCLVLMMVTAAGIQLAATGCQTGGPGEVHVDVVVDNHTITHVEILEHNEMPEFSKSMVRLADSITAKNSPDMGVISGATLASSRFLKTIKRNLEEKGYSPKDLITAKQEGDSADHMQTEYDILIIDGGGTGFSAAIETASTSNSRIIMLEKTSFGGGNTRTSGGEYAAPGNWVQQEEGVFDNSQELHYQDIYEDGGRKGSPRLIRILAERTLKNALWLRDFMGMEYKDCQPWYSGHSAPRTLWPVEDGPAYIDTLIERAEELGVDVHYNTRAVELIRDSARRVSGVRAVQMGKTVDYVTHRGVILTTGGFGANMDTRMEYDTHQKTLDASIPTTNFPAIIGDGIVMARDIGASLVGMENIRLYPVNNPATDNYYFMDCTKIDANALLLNQEGERLVDEKETRDNLFATILKQTDVRTCELIGSSVVKSVNPERLYEGEMEKCIQQGVLARGSLEGCYEYFKLPIEEVRNTIGKYNEFAAAGDDLDFGRAEHLQAISQGPYIMFSCIVSVHHTMDGVEIDEYAGVIDTSGEPIRGLCAAGEVTGGVHGSNRLGSMSIPDTVTFGGITAESMVTER